MKKTIGQEARESFSGIEAMQKATEILKKKYKKEYNQLLEKEYKKSMKTWDEK